MDSIQTQKTRAPPAPLLILIVTAFVDPLPKSEIFTQYPWLSKRLLIQIVYSVVVDIP